MTTLRQTCRFAYKLRGGVCIFGLLLCVGCADSDKSSRLLDAAPPTTSTLDAATHTSDATTSDGNDASARAGADASGPDATHAQDASALGSADASVFDAAASEAAVSDGGAADAAASTGARPLATGLTLPTTKESPGVEPVFDVFRPMDMAGAVASTGGPLPVMVWANGGCLRVALPWEPLFKRWAAAGFVVLALSVKPNGGLLDGLATTTQAEHGKLVDWALEQAHKPGSPYAGQIDTGMVVAAGNSCGGVTAMELASKDTRVRSVFVLSGSSALASANTAVVEAIKVPVGFVVGNQQEDIAAPNALMDYTLLKVPTMIVNRSTGDHLTISSDAMVLPEVAEIALNWIDLTLYGNKQAAAALSAPSVCAKCTAGAWKMQSKLLETLQR